MYFQLLNIQATRTSHLERGQASNVVYRPCKSRDTTLQTRKEHPARRKRARPFGPLTYQQGGNFTGRVVRPGFRQQ